MKTFEYKILPRMAYENELNELGGQGWDLIAAQPGGKWILKREIVLPPIHEPRKSLNPSFGIA
jgi:hypothetical protein